MNNLIGGHCVYNKETRKYKEVELLFITTSRYFKGIYLLNENILKRRLLNGERIILGVKVDNSYKIIEDTLNPFQFAYDFIGIA